MSRRPLHGEDPHPLCSRCGEGALREDPNDYRVGQIWWYEEIFAGGSVALCETCAFALCRGMLLDVLAGKQRTLGEIVDGIIEAMVIGGHGRAMQRNPYLRRFATPEEVANPSWRKAREGGGK